MAIRAPLPPIGGGDRIIGIAEISPFRRGERITADRMNQLVDGINSLATLAAPRDMDEGLNEGEIASQTLSEIGRSSVEVRIENPEDEDQYVDVLRPTEITLINPRTGDITTWELINVA